METPRAQSQFWISSESHCTSRVAEGRIGNSALCVRGQFHDRSDHPHSVVRTQGDVMLMLWVVLAAGDQETGVAGVYSVISGTRPHLSRWTPHRPHPALRHLTVAVFVLNLILRYNESWRQFVTKLTNTWTLLLSCGNLLASHELAFTFCTLISGPFSYGTILYTPLCGVVE